MSDLLRDLRFGARIIRKSPGFTAVAVLTSGLGIAGVVTVFSFSDAMFLRRLPVPNTARLMQVTRGDAGAYIVSYREYTVVRDRNRSFETLAAHYSTAPLYVRFGNTARELQGAVITSNYFPLLGIKPVLGQR